MDAPLWEELLRMVRLKLDDTHTLVSDPECYWIETLVKPEGKKPYTRRSSGYRRTFNECVESYIEKKIRSSEAAKITKLSKEIKELKKEVRGWHEAYNEQSHD